MPSDPSRAAPRVLIVGATSAIAQAVARRYALRGARLMLWARNADALAATAADLRVRGAAAVETGIYDALDTTTPVAALRAAWNLWQGFDIALIAHGMLPDQAAAEADTAAALRSFDINARSVLVLLTDLANRFEAQHSGVIGVISSPAGERGRASNYVYGTAKAAVTALCSGLRHRLVGKGVRVVTIVPGFVDTPMTAELPKGALWAQPETVAADIEAALDTRNGTLYTPWFWRWIMLVIRSVPQSIFLRSKL